MNVITQPFNTNAVCVLKKLGPGVTYVNNSTQEQVKMDIALVRACNV